MSGISKPTHLAVYVFLPGDYATTPDTRRVSYKSRLAYLENVKRQIERHCDDIDAVKVERTVVCEHCGELWEAPPYCCDAAQDKWIHDNPRWVLDKDYNWIQKESVDA